MASAGRQAASAVPLSLYDPHSASRLLAADYTTPLALELARFRPQQRGWLDLLRGGDFFDSTGLYPLETPTPDKTPVLVHGLISDSGDFHRLYNHLLADDAVRRRYQVRVFTIPPACPSSARSGDRKPAPC